MNNEGLGEHMQRQEPLATLLGEKSFSEQHDSGSDQRYGGMEEAQGNVPSQHNTGAEGLEGGIPESPEAYQFTFSDGVEVDEQVLENFREVAFSEGLSQQQAENIATMYAGLVERQMDEQQAVMAETEAGWLKELKQGREYAKTVASARLAMERFGSPELNTLFNETRLGSHPALVRFVARVGRELAEPVFIQGKGGSKVQKLNFYETMNR